MNQILFWLFLIYDAVFELPYFWVKVAFGIATGLLIPGRIIGLLACAAGTAALFMYARAGTNSASLPLDGCAAHVVYLRVFRRGVVGRRSRAAPGLFQHRARRRQRRDAVTSVC
jgi:hypothetical protein